jgi:predicted transcriptional regulator
MSGTTDTKLITAPIPLPLAEKVEQLAMRLKCSSAWIIKQALTAWIDEEEQRNVLTREAIEDVNTGKIVNHQDVQNWINNLNNNQIVNCN